MQGTLERKSQGRADSGPRPGNHPRPRAVRHVNLDLFTLKDIPDIALEVVLECLNGNEYGDALLFAELFTGRCVYDHKEGQWYIWQGHYWQSDDVQMMKHLVSGVLASTYLKAIAEVNLKITRLEAQAEEEEREAQIKRYKALAKELHTRAHQLKYVSRMKNVLSNAQAFLPVVSEQWDTDKWALGTRDGVLDLKTGQLRPGQPEDYIKTIIPTKWKGLQEPCPRFERFLQEMFADRSEQERSELVGFLHRALGYGITGLTTVHMFLFLIGDEGRNGKDTLMERLVKVLGNIAGPVNKDLMVANTRMAAPGSAKPHIASLQGKRIGFVSETDKGERFSVAQVKEYSGGGRLNARHPFGKKDFTFETSHLLVLLSNNKPHADANDQAFWNRICPIRFNMRFIERPDPTKKNEREADINLGEKLDAEASGILAWLVRGCLEWQRVGMNTPACVLRERNSYRAEEDTLGMFQSELCLTGDALSKKPLEVAASALYLAYSQWCEANGLKPMSNTSLGVEIKKKFPHKSVHGRVFYQGIGLRSEYPNEADIADRASLETEETEEAEASQGQPGPADDQPEDQPAPANLNDARARKLLEKFRAGNARGYALYLRTDGIRGLNFRLPDDLPEERRAAILADLEALNEALISELEAEKRRGEDPDFIVTGNKYIMKD